jgi:hypothetical protein
MLLSLVVPASAPVLSAFLGTYFKLFGAYLLWSNIFARGAGLLRFLLILRNSMTVRPPLQVPSPMTCKWNYRPSTQRPRTKPNHHRLLCLLRLHLGRGHSLHHLPRPHQCNGTIRWDLNCNGTRSVFVFVVCFFFT